MMIQSPLHAGLLAKITTKHPAASRELVEILKTLPAHQRGEIAREIAKYGPDTDLAALCDPALESLPLALITADEILTAGYADPVWAVPGLLPVGLTILAGAPKVGKSWLALQIAQAVASGGMVLGKRVERGPILYLALEDPSRRLKDRMTTQGWSLSLEADFLTMGSFLEQIGDLRTGGSARLASQIERRGYRLLAIDTLSRSIFGKQNEADEMTNWLAPLHEIAHERNCAILLVDHHRKRSGFDPDVIADILGSTAKGALADTVMGLYRERGKSEARLAITGREIEEKTFDLRMDWQIGCWQL